MSEQEPKQETAMAVYDLTLIKDNPDHMFSLKTQSNSIVPITIKGLLGLIPPVDGQRQPNTSELLQLVNVALGQGADPYAKECGLMPIFFGGFHYEPYVAAQVRLRKAQSQSDYRGYEWGYITKDFNRHVSGIQSKANPMEVTGVWGRVFRDGREPFYHETWMAEFRKEKGIWQKMGIGMLLKVNRDQTHKFAYADKMGNLNTYDEMAAYDADPPLSAPTCDTPKRQDRKKPVENTYTDPAPDTAQGDIIDPEPSSQASEAPVEPPAEATTPADPATLKTMYAGAYNAFTDLISEVNPALSLGKFQRLFDEFATFTLMIDKKDLPGEDDWTMPLLQALLAELAKGLPEPILEMIPVDEPAKAEETKE